MAADYGRIHRLFHIITLIQGQRGWTAAKLAAEFGVDQRTIFRDLGALKQAGVPITSSSQSGGVSGGGGYEIRRDFFMPAVNLTLDESLAIIALAQNLGQEGQIPMMHAAGKAIAKVRSSLPPAMLDQVGQLDEHIDIQLAAASGHESIEDVYQTISQAIAARRKLQCAYDSLNQRTDPGETFLLCPYCLHFNQRAWYVIGLHEGRQEVRCLRLNRFTRCQATDRPYLIPDDFSLVDLLGDAWRMVRGEPRYDVELWFDAEFAETISDTFWHRTQEVESQADGSMVFRCTVDGLDEIVWWVLSMGPHCVVRRPRALAELVRDHARATAKHYQDLVPGR